MADGNHDMLRDAIGRNAGIVLSLPSAGMLRHHKSRFLAEASDGFWAESVREERPLVDALIASQQPAGVSFKAGHLKVVFAAPVRRRDPAFRLNGDTLVEALLLGFPSEIKSIQRRNNYRVQVPTGADVAVRLWRIAPGAHLSDRPVSAQELPCRVRDLSTGGVGLTIQGEDGKPPKVTAEDRLRVELKHGETALLLEGRMRYPAAPPAEPALRAGIQFKAMENDLAGRKVLAQLTRVVGELQRDEVRRFRLGICKAG